METEYKYRLDDVSLIQEIIDDPMLDEYVDRDSLEKIRMHAMYFDTDDMDLRQSGIAYRIRYENDRITATIKWDNHVENGCHSREEFNLVITDERFAEHPNIEAFESSDAYDVLLKAAGHKELHKKVEMDFTRKLIKVDTGNSISALSDCTETRTYWRWSWNGTTEIRKISRTLQNLWQRNTLWSRKTSRSCKEDFYRTTSRKNKTN